MIKKIAVYTFNWLCYPVAVFQWIINLHSIRNLVTFKMLFNQFKYRRFLLCLENFKISCVDRNTL